MWKEYYVAALLILNGMWDWKKKEVCVPSILVSLAAGIAGNCRYQYLTVWDMAGGLGIGGFLVLLAFLTKGAIGLGDGWLLCATGAYLGTVGNFELLLVGSVFCAAVLGFGLLLGKAHWKDTFPFVPFLCAAQLLRLLL